MHFIQLSCEDINKLSQLSRDKHCSCLLSVYVALLYHADKNGKCFPGYTRIREISGVASDTSVSKALTILEEEGFIKKKSNHGMHENNVYYLPKLQLLKNRTSTSEDLFFNKCRAKVHLMKSYSSINEEEVYPYNYNHISMCNKENTYPRLEYEEKIKNLFRSLTGRELIAPEEVILQKLLYNLPGEKVLSLVEEAYFSNPGEFPRRGLTLIPNWEAYQYRRTQL